MAVRFTRVFGSYTLSSVFLPGMLFLIGILPLLAFLYTTISGNPLLSEILPKQFFAVLGGLVFITLGLFTGFGLHSLGTLIERRVGNVWFLDSFREDLDPVDNPDRVTIHIGKPHRVLFREVLNGSCNLVHMSLVSSFIDFVNEQHSYLDFDPEVPRTTSGNDSREQEKGGSSEIQKSEEGESDSEAENSALLKMRYGSPIIASRLAS